MRREAAAAKVAEVAEPEKPKEEKERIDPKNVAQIHATLEAALARPGFTGAAVKEAARKVADFLAKYK